MVVQHNISAMTANRYYGINNSQLGKSLEKLASGYAINRAGDNAAGLAVSEKMRAQIGGLTQASKNAEDGISLVQTMEGALQETDSILQRMRTLAVQSANGSYQDDVDREAMQLEFDQLNDELNQIADTDFNGVIMLNGGEMADGTKAVNGKIQYTANTPRTEAMQLGNADVNTLDSKSYNDSKAAANSLWDNLGLSKKEKSVDITFQYDKSSDTWSAISASDGKAEENLKAGIKIIKGGADADIGTPTTQANNNGGFSVVSTANNPNGTSKLSATDPAAYDAAGAGFEYANVVLDSTKLVDGDTVTITFTRPDAENSAPENIGVKENSITTKLKTGVTDEDVALPTLTVNNNAASGAYESTNMAAANVSTAKPMTETAKKGFDNLNNASVKLEYKSVVTEDSSHAGEISAADLNLTKLSLELEDGKHLDLVSADGSAAVAATTADQSFKAEDGTTYKVQFAVTDGKGTMTVKDADGNELVKIDGINTTVDKKDGTSTTLKNGETSTMSFKIAMDTATYDDASKPSAKIVDPDVKTPVSTSNAFNQSKATMTYTDHLGLQVGARTKDLVDFTFSYKSEGLGGLKANLNCSSRTDGLGTADLSIADQKSANAAIDQIDNAINKVNMVRATFGAAQNRIEHKINNIDTNTENLTAAESRIRDTQMDKEMMKFTSAQILSQASQSMLAQANSLPQGVLQLLG